MPLLLLLALVVTGCERERAITPVTLAAQTAPGVITLGDIDPDEPAKRVRRIQPLADFLGAELTEFDIGRGHVRIARDIPAMAALMQQGEVDILLDSPFPVLAVNRMVGSRSILLREAKHDVEYWSVLIARVDGTLKQLADLPGNVVVFQEPHSTSGFLLPAALLLDAGYALQGARQPDGAVADGQIGCYFSGDEENTVELVLNGAAKVGAISNQDYAELPPSLRDQLIIIARSASVPRQLVAVRKDLLPALVAALNAKLLGISSAQRAAMEAQDSPFAWTWQFSALTADDQAILANLEQKIDTLPACYGSR